jgi:hypothetical protein
MSPLALAFLISNESFYQIVMVRFGAFWATQFHIMNVSFAHTFDNAKTLSSYQIIVYIEIEKDACGDLWLLTF